MRQPPPIRSRQRTIILYTVVGSVVVLLFAAALGFFDVTEDAPGVTNVGAATRPPEATVSASSAAAHVEKIEPEAPRPSRARPTPPSQPTSEAADAPEATEAVTDPAAEAATEAVTEAPRAALPEPLWKAHVLRAAAAARSQSPTPIPVDSIGTDVDGPWPPLPPVQVDSRGVDVVYRRTITNPHPFDFSALPVLPPQSPAMQNNRESYYWASTFCRGSGSWSTTHPQFKQCHHGGGDVVSSFFMRDGYWRDCLSLPYLAHWAYNASRDRTEDDMPTVVEVGGNIGSCAMLMASQGIHVTSFEPVVDNFELLGASIYVNNFTSRVDLVCAAAAEAEGEATITVERGNFGNSVVDEQNRVGNTSIAMVRGKKVTIKLVPLDDVVHHHVHLLKLDCQGSELRALQGAKKLIAEHRVDVIRAELDGRLMNAVGSRPLDMIRLLHDAGYRIFEEDTGVPVLPGENATAFARRSIDHATDIIALSPHMVAAALTPETFSAFGGGPARAKLALQMQAPVVDGRPWYAPFRREKPSAEGN